MAKRKAKEDGTSRSDKGVEKEKPRSESVSGVLVDGLNVGGGGEDGVRSIAENVEGFRGELFEVVGPYRLNPERQMAFLKALAGQVGQGRYDVTKAARMAGVGSAAAMYNEAKRNPRFKQAWMQVEDALLDDLESRTYESAQVSGEDRRWVLSRRRRDKWGDTRGSRDALEIAAGSDLRNIPTAVLEQLVAEMAPSQLQMIAQDAEMEEE